MGNADGFLKRGTIRKHYLTVNLNPVLIFYVSGLDRASDFTN